MIINFTKIYETIELIILIVSFTKIFVYRSYNKSKILYTSKPLVKNNIIHIKTIHFYVKVKIKNITYKQKLWSIKVS